MYTFHKISDFLGKKIRLIFASNLTLFNYSTLAKLEIFYMLLWHQYTLDVRVERKNLQKFAVKGKTLAFLLQGRIAFCIVQIGQTHPILLTPKSNITQPRKITKKIACSS